MGETVVTVDANDPKPIEVDAATMVFPASVHHLLPPRDKLPEAFQRRHDPWCDVVSQWFFRGLDATKLTPKPGIDKTKALRHCGAIMCSFAPKHEHKIGGVAYLMSKWFEPYPEKP